MHDNIMLWLQNWFFLNCNGDWEHGKGVKIETLDNPGWMVNINLEDTNLENKIFHATKRDESKNDWLVCRIENNCFCGYCGPLNLLEVLEIFRAWVESNDN